MVMSIENVLDEAEESIRSAEDALTVGDFAKAQLEISVTTGWLRGLGPDMRAATPQESARYASLLNRALAAHRRCEHPAVV